MPPKGNAIPAPGLKITKEIWGKLMTHNFPHNLTSMSNWLKLG